MTKPRLALVGAGAMGSNHARVITESGIAEVGVIIDTDPARGKALAERFECRYDTALDAAADCTGAVLATPTRAHQEQAMALIEMGRPLLVEKPLTPDIEESRAIVAASRARSTPLMCGFVERYNPAVTTAISMLDQRPVHVVSLRHSPATPRTTLSVVFDLLIHDIDLVLRYAGDGASPTVSAHVAHAGGNVSEIADCVLDFDGELIATLSASRSSQRKVRSQIIETMDAQYDIDLLRQDVTVYRHRSQTITAGVAPSYRAETIVDIPFVRHGGEPLLLQLRHFIRLLEGQVDVNAERDSILPAHEVAALVESTGA
ncbi:MAG: Gfo/Idh/MocA family oxidoreductase [Candidatus Dormibacteraeota bacterium]|nr:Gfo/Idh/MocA family oxidoreductase [Candidatus Dormibacteraeota bacterium]